METDYRTLCRIVVIKLHEEVLMTWRWMRRYFFIISHNQTWCICNIDMCNFRALNDEIALQFENLTFGGELKHCTELFAWLLPFASCSLTWKKFMITMWDRCFLSYLSFKHNIISVKIGAQIYFFKLFFIKSNPYFILQYSKAFNYP